MSSGFRSLLIAAFVLTPVAGAWAQSGADEVGPPSRLYKMGSESLPSLSDRDLGEPVKNEDGRVIYDRALPFMAQQV